MSVAIATQTPQPAAVSRWHASLALRFRQQERGCRLVSNVHHGPLYVQKPFYPEGADTAHVYLLHPPGGLVSGDRLGIDIQLEENARILVTTPGAGRVYRARADRCLQQQLHRFDLAPGSVMEWLPQEMIVYPGAFGRMDTTVNMSAGSTFIGWEVCCLGLPASAQPFTHGEVHQRLFITQDNKPVLLENLHIDPASFELSSAVVGLQSCPVSGVFVAGSLSQAITATDSGYQISRIDALMNELRAAISLLDIPGQVNVTLMNDFIIGRYLGGSAADARRIFIALWEILRPLLTGRHSCPPRIWAT